MPSVSDWKKNGIPEARMMFLRATRLEELKGIDLDAATSPRGASDKLVEPEHAATGEGSNA